MVLTCHFPCDLCLTDDVFSLKDGLAVNEADGWWNDPSDPCHVLAQCRPSIERLWNDPIVRNELARKRLRLEESSGL